ncbi:unnamed protein product [Clavelina lepadiformis]|uniref:START domain-containing protein n=1 Tax=Clavelina lepadiformis TaxID=159417 RepID=A0ABP0GX08_CLALP
MQNMKANYSSAESALFRSRLFSHGDNQLHRFHDELKQRRQLFENELQQSPETNDNWTLLVNEGDTKLYRKAAGKTGKPGDSLKAIHTVKNITASEICHCFWQIENRKEWDRTVENIMVLEVLNETSVIVKQTHHRVPPVAQRDCVFLSSIIKNSKVNSPEKSGRKLLDAWMVSNFSVDHNEEISSSGCVRAFIDVALICRTYVTPPMGGGATTRDCVTSEITYFADINPGGWVPSVLFKILCERECLNFIRSFPNYVMTKRNDVNLI